MAKANADLPERSDNPDIKRSISLRLDQADYDRVQTIAKRMRARESDVFRFLLRLALAELAPLSNSRNSGSDLLPAFANFATELTTHFRLDAARIQRVINHEATVTNRVDDDDIEMLAMAGMSHRYLAMRMADLTGKHVGQDDVLPAMRQYLKEKYLQTANVKKSTENDA